MSLRYIIDGYNIIRHRLYGPLSKASQEPCTLLLTNIVAYRLCGSRRNIATVVFDGYPPARYVTHDVPSGIQVLFSRTSSADEQIVALLEKAPNPRVLFVVSDDNEIRQSARLRRVKSLSVEEFLEAAVGGLGKGGRRMKSAAGTQAESPELSRLEMQRITQELEKRWLK